MPVTIHLSGQLKQFANGAVEIDLPGEFATVSDALATLWTQHVGLRDRIINEQGEIRQHVNIFAGTDDIKRKLGLSTKLTADSIHIFNAVSGG